jgi:hypothetical protein
MLLGSTVFMALVGTAARNIPRLAAGTNPDPTPLTAFEASSLLADPTVVVLSIEPPIHSPVEPAGFLLPDDSAEDSFHARP